MASSRGWRCLSLIWWERFDMTQGRYPGSGTATSSSPLSQPYPSGTGIPQRPCRYLQRAWNWAGTPAGNWAEPGRGEQREQGIEGEEEKKAKQ